MSADERSRSLWMDVEVAPDASPLRRTLAPTPWIIGAGIAGLSTAYELSGQGQKVMVLDRGKIGSGMTARTTAHLSANNDDTFKTMIDRRGEKLAQDYYRASRPPIDRIETIQSSERSSATSGASTGSCFRDRRRASPKSRRNTKPRRKPGCRCVRQGRAVAGLREDALPALSQSGDLPSDEIPARPCALHHERAGRSCSQTRP